ncbi:putative AMIDOTRANSFERASE/AMIDASE [Cupriavidus taiwanensis]|uniref:AMIDOTRANSFERASE/AMIDASE n=1 Tax=Cupriavidus taiwanensis TaxID=164546 RepID=A0A375E0Y2_9BURK|nr:amidase [Cupriavidus taiwanensis]SOZ51036.1 putative AMIDOTRANSFERASE/AMIDASE [Cupriavidus taiwanensis]SOZ52618.1 putative AMIDOTRANSFERASE/AMIDASE [Cupriavidus taiwanensis]SOZ54846.1 putative AMIDOTRANSFERASE/AMIDASE [Cupriavidus taiwanensis]SPA04400.1 putative AMIDOTRANSFERASE/AMIDASE [Cupriavidus taiwanensis]
MPLMLPDLDTLNARLRDGATSRAQIVEQAAARAATPAAEAVFLHRTFEAATQVARAADAASRAGKALHPLAGLPVSVKDLYDVAGEVTRAASLVRADAAPAAADAPVVARLRAAGAALVGRTNMTEFAFSGVGINPHYGTPANPAGGGDTGEGARIPGGSSSGAAVSVALGLAVAALGSDTGGSIRIPAALCGITGFKPTARRVPLAGAFPLSYTLDTACAMARTVGDCIAVDSVIADSAVLPRVTDPAATRLAIPRQLLLDDLDPVVARAFDRALGRLSAAGVRLEHVDLPELGELAALNAQGGFSAAEAYAIHRHLLAARRDRYDARVASRIDRGAGISAADYIDLGRARLDWIARMEARLAGFDAVVCPTVPMVAPEIGPLRTDDAHFFRVNALLLRNTSAFNFFDGCSLSMPCHAPDELPVGLMLSHGPMRDAALLGTALALERIVQPIVQPPARDD